MEGGVDHQRGFQQKKPELDIPPLQSKGVQFEATFSKPMMSELTYTAGPSSQPSFTKPPYIEIPPHQATHALDHEPWMDLYAQISSLGTCMEELAVVSETQFYSMKDHMDQYQIGFTSQFEYLQQRFQCMEDRMDQQQASFTSRFESLEALIDQHQAAFEHLQQRIERIEGHLESHHEEIMAYLRSVFPPPPPPLQSFLCCQNGEIFRIQEIYMHIIVISFVWIVYMIGLYVSCTFDLYMICLYVS